jgi:dTDP-4-amino-4,6-dideoxygalactose transaminase
MTAVRQLPGLAPALVQQADPRAGYRAHRTEIDAAIAGVLDGGRYVLGERVASFERAFAAYLGVAHAVGVANGTDALALALRALGVGPGDRVAVVSHTAAATLAGIAMTGASPVFVDIDPVRFTMDPASLEAVLRAGAVAAVVVVHLYGQPADLDAIVGLARRHGARLVEDCAQAHGATWHGRRVGSFGDASAFSFYPTKNLGAFGDGGLVATADADIASRLVAMRQYGWDADRISRGPGVNSRLDELHAAVLSVRLAHLDADNACRVAIADRYDALLAGAAGPGTGLVLPARFDGAAPVFHQYVLRVAHRAAVRDRLARVGIGTAIHYEVPVHRMPVYAAAEIGPGGLPRTERVVDEILSLPMFPQLSADAVERVATALLEAVTSLPAGR